MCGRFSLTSGLDKLQLRFRFQPTELAHSPRYNVAPTQEVLTVINDERYRAEYLRWGLIPSWARETSIGNRMINARAETVAEKPSFRHALLKRRCLVLTDGFYEWKRGESKRTPMRIVLNSREPFAFAGLWELWQAPQGGVIRSCAIITTSANSVMEPIHDRMPVILPGEAESLWLDPRIDDPAVLTSLLAPYPGEEMEAYEVSVLVNSPRHDAPDCVAPMR